MEPIKSDAEVLPKQRSERGDPDPPARPVEETSTDLPLEGGDQPADPRLREEQPLRGTTEVQLLGKDEKRLDLSKRHGFSEPSAPRSELEGRSNPIGQA